ncbi:MAG: 2-hydroxyacyl-CoA dehydratase family protein [Spirochaetes bacterium]|nr:2-hydroxyacyl-CoA dehydratase family protein [Spirochaetota bacterium]
MNNLQEYLAGLLDDPCNEVVEQAVAYGMIPLGYTCSLIPEPVLSAGRLFPLRLRAPGVSGTETADIYLSSVICSYTRSLLELALDSKYDFLKGWVFAASCDHLRRLYDNLGYLNKPEFSFILDVPHKNNEAAMEWLELELEKLRTALSSHFNIDMSDEVISTSIKENNIMLAELRSIGDMRKEAMPLFTGTEFHRLMMALQAAPRKLLSDIPGRFRDAALKRGGAGKFRARFMIVGGELDDPAYTGVIESMGGRVVADRYCTGSFPGLEPISESGKPLAAIALYILEKNRCPRMMEEFDRRADYIINIAREYSADGIIIQTIKFCDTWGVESSLLVAALRDAGIPVLRLEREYRTGGEGQLRTRVQAFIESMKK